MNATFCLCISVISTSSPRCSSSLACINENLGRDRSENMCMNSLLREVELSASTCLPGLNCKKAFSGLDTALYKSIPYRFLSCVQVEP